MLVDLNQACFITNWFSVHYSVLKTGKYCLQILSYLIINELQASNRKR
nr:MAG TPA: hypothetical protein [Caudoviricetes sp.]